MLTIGFNYGIIIFCIKIKVKYQVYKTINMCLFWLNSGYSI